MITEPRWGEERLMLELVLLKGHSKIQPQKNLPRQGKHCVVRLECKGKGTDSLGRSSRVFSQCQWNRRSVSRSYRPCREEAAVSYYLRIFVRWVTRWAECHRHCCADLPKRQGQITGLPLLPPGRDA